MGEPTSPRRTSDLGVVGPDRTYDRPAPERRDLGRGEYGTRREGRSRISWRAILAGTFVALAVQLMLYGLMRWAGFGLGDVSTVADFTDTTTGTGLWISLVAFVGLFFGGLTAARLAGPGTRMDGLWHGIVTWGVTVTASVVLSAIGAIGILGFGILPETISTYVAGDQIVSLAAANAAADASGDLAGWFLLGTFISLLSAAAAGFMSADIAKSVDASRLEEEYEERRRAA
jgi:hypothetical protein